MNVNDQLVSANGKVKLVMQGDGNLVLYRTDNNQALWASNTWQKPVDHAVMQADGNLVCYDRAGKAYWAAGTWGHAGAYAMLQDDGNLVIYQGNTQPNPNGVGALWASNTMQTWPHALPPPADSGDVHVDTGDWMHSSASLNAGGQLTGQTRTWCTVALRGFTGSCCPLLLDDQDRVIWPPNLDAAKHQYGVDGYAVPFARSDRTDTWLHQIDAGIVAQAAKIRFLHWHDEKNRLLADVPILIQTVQQILQVLQQLKDLGVIVSG
jgi:hypothetical protein